MPVMKLKSDSGSTINTGMKNRGMTLPDGRDVAGVPRAEVARVLMAAGIVGVSPENGLGTNLRAYAAALNSIAEEGGQRAVEDWKQRASGAQGQ